MKNLEFPIHFAPSRKLGGGWICWKDSPSPPPAPDYKGAAEQTAAGNKEAAIAAQRGSMVNQYTPYGSQEYSRQGVDEYGTPFYRADINLSPAGQKLLTQSETLGQGLFGAQNTQLQEINKRGPMDWSNVPSLVSNVPAQTSSQGSDVAYEGYKRRLDPQWQASTEAAENKLVNQGLQPGTEAYTNAMRDFNYAKNDAYSQARAAAESTGLAQANLNNQTAFNQAQLQNAASGQQIQQNMTRYAQPLNELNALRTGSQVTNPQFAGQPGLSNTGGPNYLGAMQGQSQYDMGLYNSQVGSSNQQSAGMMGLAGAAMTAAAMV